MPILKWCFTMRDGCKVLVHATTARSARQFLEGNSSVGEIAHQRIALDGEHFDKVYRSTEDERVST